jgi:hypothetical protein
MISGNTSTNLTGNFGLGSYDTRNKVNDFSIHNNTSNYEMDSFPRRNITNKLKNAQALKDKKKMRVI